MGKLLKESGIVDTKKSKGGEKGKIIKCDSTKPASSQIPAWADTKAKLKITGATNQASNVSPSELILDVPSTGSRRSRRSRRGGSSKRITSTGTGKVPDGDETRRRRLLTGFEK